MAIKETSDVRNKLHAILRSFTPGYEQQENLLDHFDSIQAVSLLNEIEQAFGLHFSPIELILERKLTIDSLVKMVARKISASTSLQSYSLLRNEAIFTAREIVNQSYDQSDMAAGYLRKVSEKIATYKPTKIVDPIANFSSVYLRQMRIEAPTLLSGGSKEYLHKIHEVLGPLTWNGLMSDEPMISLSQVMADYINEQKLIQSHHKCLEIGAGLGVFTNQLLIPEGCEYVASDIKEEFAKAHVPSRKFKVQNLNEGFGSEAYDFVLASMSLHCSQNLKKSLAIIKDALRKGGYLIFCEGNNVVGGEQGRELNMFNMVFALYEGWYNGTQFLNRDSWVKILKESGFEVVKILKNDFGYYDLGGTFVCKSKG